MSYHAEHLRLKPVLDLARQLDIATNPAPNAIFEAGSAGFQVWCIPQDCPPGWDGIQMIPGAFSKPCEYLGSVHWKWNDETIVALEIETSAYALAEQKPDEYCDWHEIPPGERRDSPGFGTGRGSPGSRTGRSTIFNREEDIAWLQEKIAWLFAQADVPMLPFEYQRAQFAPPDPYILAHYTSEDDHYVVIVSPDFGPLDFCQPSYELVRALEIWDAGDFPTDVILRPENGSIEADEGPLAGDFDDDRRETAYEDRTDGLDE